MLPKPARIARAHEHETPGKDQVGNSELMDHYLASEFVSILNLKDAWLIQSPDPWDPPSRSDEWPWQQ
jgi:hypothetical protein